MNDEQYTALINGFLSLENRLDSVPRIDDSMPIQGLHQRIALAEVVHEIGHILLQVFLELDDPNGTKRSSDTDTAF
jgi:hypothetical protein